MKTLLTQLILLALIVLSSKTVLSQRGKEGNVTITTAGTTVNTYTTLTANANAGTNSITVANATMNGGAFSTNLTQGDLVMIIQMQGINWANWGPTNYSIDINTYPTQAWSGENSLFTDYGNHATQPHKYGKVGNYLNAGNYELREVFAVSGNQITFTCSLERSYSIGDNSDPNFNDVFHVQIVRIPRYNNLTIQSAASIVAPAWDGTVGGVVSLEVNGNLALNATAGINATGLGFRGGVATGTSPGTDNVHTNGAGNGDSDIGHNSPTRGGAVGESIYGFTPEYLNRFFGYGRGAVANGGGGGGVTNAGGGGGSNVGDTTGYTGKGIPTTGYASFWNAEKPNMATTLSAGGGRGGYSHASAQNYGVTPYVGPNVNNWLGNRRKENGGIGGHPLVFNQNKMFAGGGGGAGGQDSGQGGSGGRGGGIVHLTVYGNISGSGTIVANGTNGSNTNPNNLPVNNNPTNERRRGNDGAGGGGGGGFIKIKNSNPIPSTIGLTANGGNGGSVVLQFNTSIFFPGGTHELTGPGAGGAGGGIAYTSGTPITSVVGGIPGGTTSNGSQNPMSQNFPMNGATSGGLGLANLTAPTFDIIAANDTICGSQSTTLTATTTGSFPSGSTIGWYTSQFGGSPVATGTTFNTPVLSTTTTYYVGNCPGTFRKPVTVVVGSNPVISGTAAIVDATCTTGGSISGLTASGGTGTLSYSWNGTAAPGTNLTNASAGNYTLTVTDANGCTAQSGPHTISGTGGPTITGTPVITAQTCTAQGTITGLVVNSPATITSYEWNGNASANANLTANAGSYTLLVTDANGCTAQSGPHTIGNAPTPSITGSPVIVNENCNNGGSITGLTATGGVGTYTYDWSGTTTPTADLTNVPSGNYTLTVTDGNGCTVQSGPHTINEDSNPVLGGTAVVTAATCVANGSINGITISGGITPYTYEWNGISSPSANLSAPAGNYTLVVTDANGCDVTSIQYTIDASASPVISGTPAITHVTCTTQGSITGLTVSGGTQPYNYTWNAVPSTTPDLTNATAGQYVFIVTDAAGCVSQSGPHTINQIPAHTLGGTAVITDVTCTQAGGITGITVSGGTQPYTYTWNGVPSSTINLVNAIAGTYTLVVTDANGCTQNSGPYVVNGEDVPTVAGTVVITNATCLVGGSISGLSVSGGTAPYTYEWNGSTSATINTNNLDPDDYTLIVTDANGCTATSGPYTVAAPSQPLIGANPVVIPATCLQGGSITISVSGGTTPYTYSWNGGQYTTASISNLTPGSYTVVVTDANGCTDTQIFTVTEQFQIDAQFNYSNPTFVNTPIDFVDMSTGNIINWTWIIDNDTTTTQNTSHTFTSAGLYNATLIVVDAIGCIDSITVTIEILSELEVPNVITANNDGINDFFILKGLVPQTNLLILNRWGNVIYRSSNYDNTWGGKDMSGNIVAEGVYTYVVTPPDGNQKHGFVHIVHTP